MPVSGAEILTHAGTNFERLTNFILTITFASGAATDTVTLTYASTEIGGSVTVTTSMPFQTAGGRDFPHTGALEIVGASGGKITVTVLGDETGPSPQVRIELDEDGDGSFEATLTTDWPDLVG